MQCSRYLVKLLHLQKVKAACKRLGLDILNKESILPLVDLFIRYLEPDRFHMAHMQTVLKRLVSWFDSFCSNADEPMWLNPKP
jgi:hypothetical protein